MWHTRWLETTGIYSLKILETRSLKLRCLPSLIPPGGSEGEFVPCLSPISMVAGNPGTPLICWLISSASAFIDWCDALSHVWLFATAWTVAHLAPLSMGFSRQESWSVLPFPTPGDLPNPGIETESLSSPVLAGGFFTTSISWEALPLLKVKVLVTQSYLTLFDPCGLYVLFFLVLLYVQMSLFLWSRQ